MFVSVYRGDRAGGSKAEIKYIPRQVPPWSWSGAWCCVAVQKWKMFRSSAVQGGVTANNSMVVPLVLLCRALAAERLLKGVLSAVVVLLPQSVRIPFCDSRLWGPR